VRGGAFWILPGNNPQQARCRHSGYGLRKLKEIFRALFRARRANALRMENMLHGSLGGI